MANAYDSVPNVAPTTSAPSDYNTTRANGNQFGAQVGGAVEKLGGVLQQAGSQFTDVALQQQGMINETLATDAETQAASEYGSILGKYKSLEGLEAVQALPQTVQALQSVRQKIGSQLPNPAAQRAFSLLASRREGYALQDVNLYSATQIKAADDKSASAALENSISSASDPSLTDAQFQDEKTNINFQVGRIVSNRGYGVDSGTGMQQDPTTGEYTFDTSKPEGQKAQAVYEQTHNAAMGALAESRAKAIAFDPSIGNPTKAYQWLQDNKDWIPADARAKIAAQLAAPLKNENARISASVSMDEMENNYKSFIGGGSDTSGYNEQGVSTIVTGSIPGAKITSTVRTVADNKRVGGVDNSGHLSGHALDFVPPEGMSLEDAAQKVKETNPNLKVVIEGPGSAHSTGPHIHVEWQGGEPNSNQPKANSYITKADYVRQHYDEIVNRAGDIEASKPNSDATTIDLAKERTRQYVNDVIRTQELSDRASYDKVLGHVVGQDVGGQPLTDISQLDNGPQEIRDAWHSMQVNNPLGAEGITKIVAANNRGHATTYGTTPYNSLMRVLSPDTDPNHIRTPAQLAVQVGPDKNSPLTNTGYDGISKELAFRDKDPGARAMADQEYKFFQEAYKNANPTVATNGFSATFDKKFQDQIPTILQSIQKARQEGKSVTQIFSPMIGGKPNPDYVGNHIVYPTQPEITNELQRNSRTIFSIQQNRAADLAKSPEKIQTVEELHSLINSGLIKKDPKTIAAIIRSNPNLMKKYIKQQDAGPAVPQGITE